MIKSFINLAAALTVAALLALQYFALKDAKQALIDERAAKERVQQQLDNAELKRALADESLATANKSLDELKAEQNARDTSATKAVEYAKKQTATVATLQQRIRQLEQENEQYQNWKRQPVPDAVNGLFHIAATELATGQLYTSDPNQNNQSATAKPPDG
jgi:ATP-dependent Clp protease ATP-binding subunit ClpA